MNKHVLALLCIWIVIGCSSTRVFLGSYDSVSITVSREQAKMVAENLPSETHLTNGNISRKINEASNSKLCNNIGPENEGSELKASIISSDKDLRKALSDNFNNERVVIEKRFYKPRDSTIISEVTIHPKRKYHNESADEYYLITFEAKNGLVGGSHMVLINDPLAFTFPQTEANVKTLYISHCGNIKDSKFIVKDDKTILPINVTLQILSKSISAMKKPIRIIFTVSES